MFCLIWSGLIDRPRTGRTKFQAKDARQSTLPTVRKSTRPQATTTANMSKPTLAFGLGAKNPKVNKPANLKSKPVFGAHDDDSDDEPTAKPAAKVQAIDGDLDDIMTIDTQEDEPKKASKKKSGPPKEPPKMKSKVQPNLMFGDLSSSLESRKHAEAASGLDASVYEYDAVYDSLKPKKSDTPEDRERKPKYMRNLLQAAEVRKRDALIAEEKKIAREREEEGEEFEGKEKFVTEAYKKQQLENKRLEEEEKIREAEEAKKNKGGGMSAFYRNMLKKDEARHAQVMEAAENLVKDGPRPSSEADEQATEENAEAERVRELNKDGAKIAVNEDGQVVDKRQLLKGGLNVGSKKKAELAREAHKPTAEPERRKDMSGLQMGKKQAMRERQSRMMAEQLEQSLKRSREAADAQREEAERNAKSRKTEGEISSAKERYLARKRAAEEAKQT